MPSPVIPYVSAMVTAHAITALRDKRGELAGQIDALQDQLRQAFIDMDHIDATLRMFQPDIELDEIKPKPLPPRHRAFKGQVTRAILAMLRKEGPMDARAITLRLMAERELNVNDSGLQKAMHKRIGAALRNLRERTLVLSRSGPGGLLVWSLTK
jgi:hypothetical protein|tara:strand:- start:305 stop:769 length:465 start_codon:yes stop_codon:yes gene_type:complete